MKRTALLSMALLTGIFGCPYPVFAGTAILPCTYRVEVDNNNPPNIRDDQARLGRDSDGATDRPASGRSLTFLL